MRYQNSLPLTTNFSQKLTQPSKGITQMVTFADVPQNGLCPLPIHYIEIRYPKQMGQMAFCDLSHTYHKQVTNISPACFCHPTVGNFDVSPNILPEYLITTSSFYPACPLLPSISPLPSLPLSFHFFQLQI